MKMRNKALSTALAIIGFSSASFAQSTATASTTATLVTPIAISKTTDLHFGTLASSGTDGTVVLDYANGRTSTGGVKLLAGTGDQATAVFAVTGEGTSTFSISVPSSAITLNGSVSGTLTVDNFVADLGGTGTLTAGSATVKVKATLNVPAASVAGTYTNASDLFVTVNYN